MEHGLQPAGPPANGIAEGSRGTKCSACSASARNCGQMATTPRGWIKINFGGSRKGVPSRRGAGFCVRADIDMQLAAGPAPCQVSSVPETEIRGAWEGFAQATENLPTARVLVVEGDAHGVIEMPSSASPELRWHPLTEDDAESFS